MTPEAEAALATLRSGDSFAWYVIPLLAFVIYAYASALRRGEREQVVLAVGFFAVELLWEMCNGLVLFFSNYAALWMVLGKSAFTLYVGLNLEIAFMFASRHRSTMR